MTLQCVHLLVPQKSKKDAESAVLGILHHLEKSKGKIVSCIHDHLFSPEEGRYPECSTWHGKKEEKKEYEILYFSWMYRRKEKKKKSSSPRKVQKKNAVQTSQNQKIYLPYAEIFPKKIHGNRGEIRGERYKFQKAYVIQVFSEGYPVDIRIFKTVPTAVGTIRDIESQGLEAHILPNPVKLTREFWEEWKKTKEPRDRGEVAKKYGILKDDSILHLEKFTLDIDSLDGTEETFQKVKKAVEEALSVFGIEAYQLFRSRNGGVHAYIPIAPTVVEKREIDWDKIREEIADRRIRGRLNRLLKRYSDEEKIEKAKKKGEKTKVEGVKIAIILRMIAEYDYETAQNFYDFSKKFLIRSEKTKNIDMSTVRKWGISTEKKGIYCIFTFSLPVALQNLLNELLEIAENPPMKIETQEFYLSPEAKGKNGHTHIENLQEVVAIISAYLHQRFETEKIPATADENFIHRINHPVRLEADRVAKKNGTPVEMYDLYATAKKIQKEKSLYRFGSINLTQRFWTEKWKKMEAGKIIVPEFVKKEVAEDIEMQELWKIAVKKLAQNHRKNRWKKIILPAVAWAISIGIGKEEITEELSKIVRKKDLEKEIEKAWKYCEKQGSEFWERFSFKAGDRPFQGRKLWEYSDEVLRIALQNGGKISRQEVVRICHKQEWLSDIVLKYLHEIGYITFEKEIYGRGRPRKIAVLTEAGIQAIEKRHEKQIEMVSLLQEYIAIARQRVAVGQVGNFDTKFLSKHDFTQNINPKGSVTDGLVEVGNIPVVGDKVSLCRVRGTLRYSIRATNCFSTLSSLHLLCPPLTLSLLPPASLHSQTLSPAAGSVINDQLS